MKLLSNNLVDAYNTLIDSSDHLKFVSAIFWVSLYIYIYIYINFLFCFKNVKIKGKVNLHVTVIYTHKLSHTHTHICTHTQEKNSTMSLSNKHKFYYRNETKIFCWSNLMAEAYARPQKISKMELQAIFNKLLTSDPVKKRMTFLHFFTFSFQNLIFCEILWLTWRKQKIA